MKTLLRFSVSLSAFVLAAASLASATPIINGDFETGDFTGFTQGGNSGYTFVDGGQNGTNEAFLGPVGSDGTLSQTFDTTAGNLYTLNFDLFAAGDAGPSDFSVMVDGVTLLTLGDPTAGVPVPQQNMTYNLAFAGTGSDTFTFSFREDPDYLQLDNISDTDLGAPTVAATPEPSSFILLGTGALGIVGAARRRFRRA